ncbi:WD40 repeat-like protein [Clavulina sp. PMI_390]|nr:WD40 repeat-like protein [Clavulina sp. PMI_390]
MLAGVTISSDPARSEERLTQLAVRSEQSFQWAATACMYICDLDDGDGTLSAASRIQIMLSTSSNLNDLYTKVFDTQFGNSQPQNLHLLQAVLGMVVAAQKPLSLASYYQLAESHSLIPPNAEFSTEVSQLMRRLASLVSGTDNVKKPLVPLHTSFTDFLQHPRTNEKYKVDLKRSHLILAAGCLNFMQNHPKGLRFNICKLETSVTLNSSIENLPVLIQEHIGEMLIYSCQFWALHCAEVARDQCGLIVPAIKSLLSSNKLLHWLEVMSLLGTSAADTLSALTTLGLTYTSALSYQMEQGIANHVIEAMRFTSYFAIPIALSAPHVYLSTIPFIPTSSPLFSLAKEYKNTLRITNGQSKWWPALSQQYQAKSEVTSVSFAAKKGLLAAGHKDGSIVLWNIRNGQQEGKPLTGHNGFVCSVAMSPDGALLASGSEDKTIRMWDAQTQEPKGQPLTEHDACVRSVAFSPDGTLLASGSEDNTIIVWDVQTQAVKGPPLTGHDACVKSVAFSPDGTLLASGSDDDTIRLWDVQTLAPKGQPLIDPDAGIKSVEAVAFSPDGALLAAGSDDHSIRLWDVHTQAAIGKPLIGHKQWVTSVAFSPDGTLLASGSADRTVILWDVNTQAAEKQAIIEHNEYVTSVAFLPGRSLLASGSGDKKIRLWDVQAHSAKDTPQAGQHHFVNCVAFSPDGNLLASGCYYFDDCAIQLWDINTQTANGRPLTGHYHAVTSVAFSPDGTLLASGSEDKTVKLWDVQTQAAKGKALTGHYQAVTSVAFSQDGTLLASGSYDNTIRLWDVQYKITGGVCLSGHGSAVHSVAFSPDGVLLASGSSDMTIRLWDVQTQAATGSPLAGHDGRVTSVAFSPDGNLLVSGSWDYSVRLWDVGSRAGKGKIMTGHCRPVTSVSFSGDGTTLASGSYDCTVRLWDVTNQAAKGQPLVGHHGQVSCVAFQPSGSLLASGSGDTTVRLWDSNVQINNSNFLQSTDGTLSYKETELGFGSHGNLQPSSTTYSPKIPQMDVPVHDLPFQISLSPSSWQSVLQHGWLTGPHGELILWIPIMYRGPPYDGRSIAVLGKEMHSFLHVNIEKMILGHHWSKCQTSTPGQPA